MVGLETAQPFFYSVALGVLGSGPDGLTGFV